MHWFWRHFVAAIGQRLSSCIWLRSEAGYGPLNLLHLRLLLAHRNVWTERFGYYLELEDEVPTLVAALQNT